MSLKYVDAPIPRPAGSTAKPDQTLELAYYFFQAPLQPNKVAVNLIFTHGTGMTKEVWSYHINKLLATDHNKWYFRTIISLDAVNHGDSAMKNKGKLGYFYPWEQGSRDLIHVVKHQQKQGNFLVNSTSRNIIVGHSLGATQALIASFYEPSMFDSVIAMEPVIYTSEKTRGRFVGAFTKMDQLLIDTFESQEECDEYFGQFSFYKVLDPRVLKNFVKGTTYFDEKSGKIKDKCTKDQQLLTYYGGNYCLTLAMQALPVLQVPVCHVIGTKAVWNPPEGNKFVRNNIPKSLLTAVDLEAEHLLNGQKPDEVVDLIEKYIEQRVEKSTIEYANRLESRITGTPEQLQRAFLEERLAEYELSKPKM